MADDPYAAFSSPAEDPYAAFAAKAQPQPGMFQGVARGLESGIPGMDRAIAAGKTYLPQSLGGNQQDYAANLVAEQAKQARFQQANPGLAAVGGMAAQAPLALLPGGTGLASRAAIGGLEGGLAAGLQGAASSPDLTNAGETLGRGLLGAGIGAPVGAVAGAASPLVSGLLGRAVSPLPANAERVNAADFLRTQGVPLTGGNVTGSPMLQRLEARGLGSGAFSANQNAAYTKAVAEQGGLPSANIAESGLEVGRTFNKLAERNEIDPKFLPELAQQANQVASGYDKLVRPSPELNKIADRIDNLDGPVSGTTYKEYRTELGDAAFAAGKQGNAADSKALGAIKDAWDNAMEKSIAANNPQDAGAFSQARFQWSNLQPIAKALSKSKGEAALSGNINPVALQNALKSGRDLAYLEEKGPLDRLARAGVGIGVGQPPPEGNLVGHLSPYMLGGALGGAYGYHEGRPEYLAAGLAAPRLAGSLARAPGINQYLGNQFTTRYGAPAMNQSALAAALAQRIYGNAP